jgi:hypothetical protein
VHEAIQHTVSAVKGTFFGCASAPAAVAETAAKWFDNGAVPDAKLCSILPGSNIGSARG